MHSTSANHAAYSHGQYLAYGTASPKYSASNAQTWGNNPDPRSVPPLPASLAHAGSRRNSKETAHHPHTYTTSPPERYALKSPGPGIKMEYGAHRAQYSGWNDGEQDEATYRQQTDGVADYWYHARHDSKQRSGAASPNYAYSKPTPTHRQSIGRSGHQEYYGTESHTEPRTQRGTYNDPNLPWGLDASVPGTVSDAAAQKAMNELFPELTGDVDNVDYYSNPSYYVEPSRRYPNSRRTTPPQTVIAPSALSTAHKVSVQENSYYPSATDNFLSDAYDEHDFSDDTDDETTMSNFPVKTSTQRVSPTATLETSGPATPIYHGAPSTPRPRRPANDQAFDETDALLVQYRKMGVSYKAIKAKLGLDEAESTLRGRYRTLTKPKNERLRKPVWSETDLQLLIQAVDPDLPHVKWKQVADTIVGNGGSYRFGSSTCKKQYIQLVEQGRAPPLVDMGGVGGGVAKRRKGPRTRV